MKHKIIHTRQIMGVIGMSLLFALLWTGNLPAAEHKVIELWPEGVPGLRPDASDEKELDGRFTLP